MLVTLPFTLAPIGIALGDDFPRILVQLLHAERNTLRLGVDADDLDLHRLADMEDVGRMVDALPGDVGDVEQASMPPRSTKAP